MGQRESVTTKTSHVSLVAFSELDWNRDFGCKALSVKKTAAGEVSLAFSLCKVAGIKALGSRLFIVIQKLQKLDYVINFFQFS